MLKSKQAALLQGMQAVILQANQAALLQAKQAALPAAAECACLQFQEYNFNEIGKSVDSWGEISVRLKSLWNDGIKPTNSLSPQKEDEVLGDGVKLFVERECDLQDTELSPRREEEVPERQAPGKKVRSQRGLGLRKRLRPQEREGEAPRERVRPPERG